MHTLKSYFNENLIEAGTDEAGRGCLAGPVVAASVILDKNFNHPLLNDSKKLSKSNRDELRKIIENSSIEWKVEFIDSHTIDSINILNSSILAMQKATLNFKNKIDLLLVDGNRFHKFEIPHVCIVKGDSLYKNIAAASILAKTHRDEFMQKIHLLHPEYHWDKNMGYPSKKHKEAIEKFGLTPFHRKTFNYHSNKQLNFNFN